MSASPPTLGTPSDVATVVTALHIGRRDHYRLAASLLARKPRRVVLMQRSSSLLLGPELGWHEEAEFFDAAWRNIRGGAEWFHIASATGIRSHLRRLGSSFPDRQRAQARLRRRDGIVGLGCGDTPFRAIRQLPAERPDLDLKVDRQARLLLGDFGDNHEAIIVVDVGDQQCSVRSRGPYARELFELCLQFWADCPDLRTVDLDRLQPTAVGSAARQGPA